MDLHMWAYVNLWLGSTDLIGSLSTCIHITNALSLYCISNCFHNELQKLLPAHGSTRRNWICEHYLLKQYVYIQSPSHPNTDWQTVKQSIENQRQRIINQSTGNTASKMISMVPFNCSSVFNFRHFSCNMSFWNVCGVNLFSRLRTFLFCSLYTQMILSISNFIWLNYSHTWYLGGTTRLFVDGSVNGLVC